MENITEKVELKVEIPKWAYYQLSEMYSFAFHTVYVNGGMKHFSFEEFAAWFLQNAVQNQNAIFNKLSPDD